MEIPLHVDRTRPEPLTWQLYDQIKDGIETGRLPPGTRLPASRELATRLQVGRNIVADAYFRLAAEGYVDSRVGVGTAVRSSPPNTRVRPPSAPQRVGPDPRLSRRMRSFPAIEVPETGSPTVAFDFRSPAAAAPMGDWQRILARHWSALESGGRSAGIAGDDTRLREQVTRYLAAARAVDCTVDDVVITNNLLHGLTVLAHLALDPGDQVLLEDPGNFSARLSLLAHGVEVVPVRVDDRGVDPDAVATATSDRTRCLFVAPFHQFPTGTQLATDRRAALLEWAATSGALLVEDDRDSAYSYEGETPGSLQGLDSEHVVYMGTLHRLIGGVSVGYLVLPRDLAGHAARLQWVIDRGPPGYVQSALAEFMASGLFARHVRRLQRLHRPRRDTLVAALRSAFGDDVIIGPAASGTFVHVRWRRHPATDELLDAALRADVGLRAAAPFHHGSVPDDPGVLMFYGGLDENSIREGVQRLADVLAVL